MDHSNRIYQDAATAIQYRTNRYIGGPGAHPEKPLSFKDRMELYCQTISNDFDEWQYCRDTDRFDLWETDETLMTIMNYIDHDWFREIKRIVPKDQVSKK